jgi:hypothetical protein
MINPQTGRAKLGNRAGEALIQAIPTRYAGCHFRSRLEARWAVFFDALGIRWQYEPEGFVGWNEVFYLPDFHLTDLNVYVEVKGTDEALRADGVKLASCIDYESTPLSKAGLLILGNIPRGDGWGYSHSFLNWRKGVQHRLAHFTDVPHLRMGPQPPFSDYVNVEETSAPDFPSHATTIAIEWDAPGFTDHAGHWTWPPHYEVNAAYVAARSARFEHGQNGAT